MHSFLVTFWHFLPMRHPNGTITALLKLRCTNTVHKTSKTKVPKDSSFQWFLESIASKLLQTGNKKQENNRPFSKKRKKFYYKCNDVNLLLSLTTNSREPNNFPYRRMKLLQFCKKVLHFTSDLKPQIFKEVIMTMEIQGCEKCW